MKHLLLIGVMGLWIVSLSAQTFPLTVKAYWLPNVMADGVSTYALTVDGGAPVVSGPTTSNDSNCPVAQYPAGCVIVPVVIPVAGNHTFVVIANNSFGPSDPSTVIVNINKPGQVVWVKVAK